MFRSISRPWANGWAAAREIVRSPRTEATAWCDCLFYNSLSPDDQDKVIRAIKNSMCDLNSGRTRPKLERDDFHRRLVFQVFALAGGKSVAALGASLGGGGQPRSLRIFLTCATPVYETNDDLMMQAISSGFYTGHPDAHLVFTNILIGWALQFLYGTWGSCNWYFFLPHSGALRARFTAIAFLVVSRRGGWLFALLYIGFFLVVEMRILLHLQFTTTAFLVGTAGLLLLVDGLRPGHPVHWSKVIAGIVFGCIMCLIREPVALLLSVTACPFLLETVGLAGWRRLLELLWFLPEYFYSCMESNSWAYQRDPGWAEFLEYNHMRGEIHVTALAEFIPKADPRLAGVKMTDGCFLSSIFPTLTCMAACPRCTFYWTKLRMLEQAEPASARTSLAGFLFLPNVFLGDAGWLLNLAMLKCGVVGFVAGGFRRRFAATLLIYYGFLRSLVFFCLYDGPFSRTSSLTLPACLFTPSVCIGSLASPVCRPGNNLD